MKDRCSKAKYGKGIQRSEYQEHINRNKERIEKNKDYYRQRQTIVEHPYGTIKRQWGFNYIMTKKYIKRAEADVGFVFTAYNLRRIINLIGIETLQSHFREILLLFFTHIARFKPRISLLAPLNLLRKIIPQLSNPILERLIFG